MSTQDKPIVTYKGFDKNLQCRGFQYEVGKEYEHDGEAKACNSGFHACEYPLDVFGYYEPAGSRFAVVEQSGQLSRHDDDSKVASTKIKVTAEIGIPGIVRAAIEYTMARAKPVKGSVTRKDNAASAATGYRGAASATGNWGAASATGDRGAAISSGYRGRVMGKDGCAIFLVERDENYEIIATWSGIAGRDGIKANTWYTMENGKPVEVV